MSPSKGGRSVAGKGNLKYLETRKELLRLVQTGMFEVIRPLKWVRLDRLDDYLSDEVRSREFPTEEVFSAHLLIQKIQRVGDLTREEVLVKKESEPYGDEWIEIGVFRPTASDAQFVTWLYQMIKKGTVTLEQLQGVCSGQNALRYVVPHQRVIRS